MLGLSVSEATVSLYLRAQSRPPGQTWRTLHRNQALTFVQNAEEQSRGDAGLHIESYWAQLKRRGGSSCCNAMAWAQARPGSATSDLERWKNLSALRSVRSRSDASHCLRVRRLTKSAIQPFRGSFSDRKSGKHGSRSAWPSADSSGRVGAESRQNSLPRSR